VGDVAPVDVGQRRTLRAAANAELELMVIGVARDLAAKDEFMRQAALRNPRR
jgi:hypothetical protein